MTHREIIQNLLLQVEISDHRREYRIDNPEQFLNLHSGNVDSLPKSLFYLQQGEIHIEVVEFPVEIDEGMGVVFPNYSTIYSILRMHKTCFKWKAHCVKELTFSHDSKEDGITFRKAFSEVIPEIAKVVSGQI